MSRAAPTNRPSEDKVQTAARHDLLWNGPGFFGLRWNRQYPGLADGFTAESAATARKGRVHQLGGADGDIYLGNKPAAPGPAARP